MLKSHLFLIGTQVNSISKLKATRIYEITGLFFVISKLLTLCPNQSLNHVQNPFCTAGNSSGNEAAVSLSATGLPTSQSSLPNMHRPLLHRLLPEEKHQVFLEYEPEHLQQRKFKETRSVRLGGVSTQPSRPAVLCFQASL